MASAKQCQLALGRLIERLDTVDPAVRAKYDMRTVSCRVTDLDLTYHATVTPQGVNDLRSLPYLDGNAAQLRATVGSDDLLALVDGALSPGVAWASGRLRVEAGVLDLLRLRALL